MQKKLMWKLSLIALMSLLLVIPLAMIEDKIAERSARQQDVIRDIAETAAPAQTLIGPVLAVRYRERVEVRDKGEGQAGAARFEHVERTQVLPPQALEIRGAAQVESRSRGLYRASLYHLDATLDGHFVVPPGLGLGEGRDIQQVSVFLVLGVSDTRGMENDPAVTVNGQTYRFANGNARAIPSNGLHVALGSLAPDAGGRYAFNIPLQLAGSAQLAIAPAGESTTVTLDSPWPHPSFLGRFLPVERTVGSQGFQARWQVSQLARDFSRVLRADSVDDDGRPEALVIGFIDPVNIYLQAERAVKYGVLFIALTFSAFFLVETLRRLAIHPLQYLLVGLALATFFLLLIALSEHLPFALAYAVSAAACIGLVGTYLAGVLGRLQGAAFGVGIAALYGVLYGVLRSEDNALLMGALLLFVALAATMLATRRIDWYRLGNVGAQVADVRGEAH